MLSTVAAVAVGQGLPSEARADHYQFNVTVEKSPSEGGTVTGDGIDCGTDCTGTFAHAVVCDELGCWDTYSGALRATPAPGYAVEGWTGCQGGSWGDSCFVMSDGSDQTVTARFRKAEPPVDTGAPDTTITSGPSGTVRSTTASFGFSSSESGSTFECSLDGGPFTACASPKDYSALSQGGHTLEVAATDAAGNRDATPATRSWNVDSIAPTAAAVSPSPGATRVSPTADVLASFSEAMQASTISGTTVKLTRNGTPTPVTATVTYDSSLHRAKLDPSSSLKVNATYTAIVTTGAQDLAGNPLATSKTWSFTVKR